MLLNSIKQTMAHRSGFVAIIGRPNVGKSTLLNAIIGEKIAITSPKPQTTRHRILGIHDTPDHQIAFVDTPGLHKGKDLLNIRIDQIAQSVLKEVDVIIFVVDHKQGAAETKVIDYFKKLDVPVFLVINKIDQLASKSNIDEIIISYLNQYPFEAIIPLSAKTKQYLEKLIEQIVPLLPEGPKYFPSDMKSDQTDKMRMAELIREKILYLTEQEVPHAVAVVIENMTENDATGTLDVSALIIVERPTQKQILIGKHGEKMKNIGTQARLEINRLLHKKIHLDLWVKVKKDWRNREADLKAYGYGDDR